MSPASLLASALLSFWLWQLPPDPYGLPTGAKPGSDQTAANGTRTITYESQGNEVEVTIDPTGATTETTTAPNGQETTRQYQTDFNGDGTRTETRDEGPGRTSRRTVDANGRRIKSESIEEHPVEGDSTTTRREIRTTEYDPNTGRRTSVTTTNEEEGLVPGWDRAIKRRSSVTETFDQNGNRTSRTREQAELVEVDNNGVPIYRGTRVTQTRGADGKIATTREILDPNTQQWVPEPTEAPPATDPEPEPEGPVTSEGPARRAGYVALSPGIIHIALPDSVGYQWGLRGGVEFPCGGPCAIATGLVFQHSVASANAHELRTQAEVMPGARLLDDRLFVFGDVAIGHVANTSSFELLGMTERFTQHGVVFSPGAGVSYAVWRELYVGGRFGADLQWFPSSSGTFAAHHLALEAFLGYRFGF